ncbi:hypothetical protein DYB32_005934 [Aphanomyces invadans]|uniref:Uncharacterized protein n=1 Tax=Aphanomyces invadans TaxID=157072 RepID=A0A3R6YXF8_9STRA|nr:hypothetical protein DYB32_005934 [Aphanomyces invadans]
MDLRQFLKAPSKPDLEAVKAKISASYSTAKQQKEARQICQLEFDESVAAKKPRLADAPVLQSHTTAAAAPLAPAVMQPLTPLTVAGLTLPPDFNRFKPVLLNLPAEFQRVHRAPPRPDVPSTTPPTPALAAFTQDALPAVHAAAVVSSPADLSKSQRKRLNKQKRKHDEAATTKSVRFALDSNDDGSPIAPSASSSATARHRQKQAALRARASEKRAMLGLPSLPPPAWSSPENEDVRQSNKTYDSSDDEPLVVPKKAASSTFSSREKLRQAALSAFQSAAKANNHGGVDHSSDSSDELENPASTANDDAERLRTHAHRQEILKARAEEKRLQVEAEAKLKALKAPELQAIADREARRQAEEAMWMANEWERMEKERERLEAVKLQLAKERRAKMEADRLKLEEQRRLLEAEVEKLAAIRSEEERGAAVERSAALVQLEARRKEVARQVAEAEARRQKRLERQLKQTPDSNLTLNLNEDKSDESSSNESEAPNAASGPPPPKAPTSSAKPSSDQRQNSRVSGPMIPPKGKGDTTTQKAGGARTTRRLSMAGRGRQRSHAGGPFHAISRAHVTTRKRGKQRAAPAWYTAMVRQKHSLDKWLQATTVVDERVNLLEVIAEEKQRFGVLERAYWSRATGMSSGGASRRSMGGRGKTNIDVREMAASSSSDLPSSSDSSESSDDDERGVRFVDDAVEKLPAEQLVHVDHVQVEAPSELQSLANNVEPLELAPGPQDGDDASGLGENAVHEDVMETSGSVQIEHASNVWMAQTESNDVVGTARSGGEAVVNTEQSPTTTNVQAVQELSASEIRSLPHAVIVSKAVEVLQTPPTAVNMDELEKQKHELELLHRALEAQKRKVENALNEAVALSAGSMMSFLTPPSLIPPSTVRAKKSSSQGGGAAMQKRRQPNEEQTAPQSISNTSDEFDSSGADDSDWESKVAQGKLKKRRGKLARLTRQTAKAMQDMIEIVSDDDRAMEVSSSERAAAPPTNVVDRHERIAQLDESRPQLERDEDGATLI